MSKVEALKNLAVAIGCADSVDKITAANTVGVINYMAAHYGGGTACDTLTVKSVAGTQTDYSKITVTPALTSGNSYVYKVSASEIDAPVVGDDMSDWTAWDGKAEINGEDGHKIGICEVNANKKAVKFGQATMTVNVG